MFSKQVLGTRSFRLRALWNVLGTSSFRFKIGTHLGLRSMTYCVYTVQRFKLKSNTRLMRSVQRALFVLIAVCVLSPAQLEHVLGFTSFRLHFGGVLNGRFVPRTWFDRVPAGTVLEGTQLFRTRSDYKKWCVPRTCSRNMFQLEPYREHMWTLGYLWDLAIGPEKGVVHCHILPRLWGNLSSRLTWLWTSKGRENMGEEKIEAKERRRRRRKKEKQRRSKGREGGRGAEWGGYKEEGRRREERRN